MMHIMDIIRFGKFLASPPCTKQVSPYKRETTNTIYYSKQSVVSLVSHTKRTNNKF